MNLNPLKKDDNTDALVKALEDANSASSAPTTPSDTPVATDSDTMQVPPPPSIDDSIIAADPQVMGNEADETTTPPASTVEDAPALKEDASAGIAFSGDNLPAGLSSDADAHLPSEGSGENGELDEVKKNALEQLRPLIEKLDLEPADKFDKYLMMLRASDDPALIKPAYDAAKNIPGEKEKAQALLDIINEINYITANKQ